MDEERRVVTVSTDSIEAYAEPQFVLEYDGKIFVTLAVIEYDPGDEDLDEDEAADLAQLQRVLGGDRDVSGTVLGPQDEPPTMAQTQD